MCAWLSTLVTSSTSRNRGQRGAAEQLKDRNKGQRALAYGQGGSRAALSFDVRDRALSVIKARAGLLMSGRSLYYGHPTAAQAHPQGVNLVNFS